MGKAERDGSNEFADYQPGSLNTTDTLVKDLDNYDIVFHIGDLPYANGYISQWDQFTAQVEPITARKPYTIASGNHERTWTNSGGFFLRQGLWWRVRRGGRDLLVLPGGEQSQLLVQGGLRHVPVLHCRLGARLASGHAAVQVHRGMPLHRGPEALAMAHLRGHVHNYERTCPIYQSQCMTDEKSHYSGTMNGTIFVVAGGGGSHLSDYTPAIPTWSIFRDHDFGFVKLTAFNHSSLLFEYKKSSDGKVYDSFTIDRDYRDVLSCVHDSCFPTTLAS
ncbi:unnamed protein product [Urochloa humidicola]